MSLLRSRGEKHRRDVEHSMAFEGYQSRPSVDSRKKAMATNTRARLRTLLQSKWVVWGFMYCVVVSLLLLLPVPDQKPWVAYLQGSPHGEIVFKDAPDEINCGATVDDASREQIRTIRVAIVLYGMARNACPLVNIADVFVKPLHEYSRQHRVAFVYDIFVDANIANASNSVRFGIKNSPVDVLAWKRVKACYNQIRNQVETDKAIESTYQATFGVYGDAWEDTTGSTTKNLLRALYSQKQAAELVKEQERLQAKQYDVVVVSRLDVLHTLPTPSEAYAAIVYAKEVRNELLLYSPNWQMHSGYNDRYYMGERDVVLATLSRFDRVKEYVSLKKRAINSEAFLSWILQGFGIKSPSGTDHAFKFVLVDWVANRRVRSTNKTNDVDFDWRELKCRRPCALLSIDQCHVDVIAATSVCDCGVTQEVQVVPKPMWIDLSLLNYY